MKLLGDALDGLRNVLFKQLSALIIPNVCSQLLKRYVKKGEKDKEKDGIPYKM